MKSRALITGDIHLSDNIRDSYRIELMRKVVTNWLDRYEVTDFIVLGDLTEAKDGHHAYLVNTVVDLFYQAAKRARVYILLGNHDYIDRDQPYFAFLSRINGVKFITEPKMVPLNSMGGDCFFCPHIRNPSDKQRLQFMEIAERAKVVFAHQTFQGAVLANGRAMEDGWPDDAFGDTPVIAGDIHVAQEIGKTIEYVGAPYAIDFGDSTSGRMVLFEDGKRMKDLPVICPQKRVVEIARPEDINTVKFNKGDVLKIVCKQQKDVAWADIANRCREIAIRKGANPHTVLPDLIAARGKKERVHGAKDKDNKTDGQLLDEFSKRTGLDDKITNTGHYLMEKARD